MKGIPPITRPEDNVLFRVTILAVPQVLLQPRDRANLQVAPEQHPTCLASFSSIMSLRFSTRYPSGTSPHPTGPCVLGGGDLVADALARDLPLELANESSTLSVSRPMLVVVLNACVTETNDTPCASKAPSAWRSRRARA